jgi:hypothetical protein
MDAVLFCLSNLIRKVLGGDKECLPAPHLSSQKLYVSFTSREVAGSIELHPAEGISKCIRIFR